MEKFTLRRLCELGGISRRAIQGYEKAGLLSPIGRNERGYLLYDGLALEKAIRIRKLQDYGFTVKEVVCYLQQDENVQIRMLGEKLEKLLQERAKTDTCIVEIEYAIRKKTERLSES